MTYRLIHGDCLAAMPTLAADSIDAVVCDPPYGLAFMGKAWDHGVPGAPFWSEALRVAKPGSHLLAFGGTRTFHRLTCAIEDAGWEIRDCLSWLYGSGFPKSHNGPWGGTALKPAWEPIIIARKPLIGTVAANVEKHGTGALNIDGCRIGTDAGWEYPNGRGGEGWHGRESLSTDLTIPKKAEAGRWPANVALDEDAAKALDEQSGLSQSPETTGRGAGGQNGSYAPIDAQGEVPAPGDFGGASRFFYTAKASRGEREAGLREATFGSLQGGGVDAADPVSERFTKTARNTHPTVKPVDLMRWLVRLVTPTGGVVLDPFTGSGTTGVAAIEEGCSFIGIEREAEYVKIAEARLSHASKAPMLDFTTPAEKPVTEQLALDL